MRLFSIVALLVFSTGCVELHQHALGTRVHSFKVKDKEYIHCSILMDRARPEMVEDSLKVCRDGVK